MPTFTTSREATKDEMAREIDRCHKVIVELEAALATRVPDREAVADLLRDVRDHLWNAFEPDNQSRMWKRVDAAIAAMQETKP
jgi:hypothetical protein